MGGEHRTFCCAHRHDVDDGVAERDGLKLFTQQPGLGEENPHATRLVLRPITVDINGEVLGDADVARIQESGEDAENGGIFFWQADSLVGPLFPLVPKGSDEEIGMVLSRFGVDIEAAAVPTFTNGNCDGGLFRVEFRGQAP